jgi:DNA-binding LacI/PurR family transcriptional regulator
MPGLTTLAMPMSELGGAAARMLEHQLALGGRHQPERHTFSAELIVRDSSLRPVGALA